MKKPLRCRLGVHAYVAEHHRDDRPHGPNQKVCRLCGKRPMAGENIMFLGGGG